MSFFVRAEGRPPRLGASDRTRVLRRAAFALLPLSLFMLSCGDRELGDLRGGASSAGAPPSGPDGDGNAGEGGSPADSSGADGGASGAKPDGDSPATDPSDGAGGRGPEVDEPGVDEPGVDEPDDEDPPDEPDDEDPPDEPDDGDPPDEPDDGDPPDERDDDPTGLPCAVQELLRTRCHSCHSDPPVAGASVSLLTYADLTAPSKVVPSVTVAARSLERMKSAVIPMPPAPASPATTEEIASLQAWVEAGTPHVQCEEEPRSSTNPYDAPPTCTSNIFWGGFDSGSPGMQPGAACISCHRGKPGKAPRFTIAGTVFPTAHEPNLCYGVPLSTGAQIIITDANGQEQSPVRVVNSGNFFALMEGLALPYRAKLVVNGEERVMLTPQMDGDCNGCHTQSGSQGALGRIILP